MTRTEARTGSARESRRHRAIRHDLAHPARVLTRLAASAALLAASAVSAQTTSTVTTGGFFYGYSGPVGAPIYRDFSGGAPYRDPAPYKSHFAGGIAPFDVVVTPQRPYAGYEGAAYVGTGTASVVLPDVAETLRFWNEVAPTQNETPNALSITGAVTQGVFIDPATQKSNFLHLATFTFTNGSWFSVEPPYDPGLGPLYAPSRFDFSLIVRPDPYIGHPSGFNGYDVWNDTLVLTSTFGANTPDVWNFVNAPFLGGVAVNEGVTGSVQVWGKLGSVEVLELRNPTAGIAILASAVPEPETWALVLAGSGLVAIRLRRAERSRRSRTLAR